MRRIMISFAKIKSDTFLLVWNIASVVTFVLPLFAFSVARLTSDRDWNEDQNDNDNNQYQNNYENPDYYDEYGNYIGPNHWWEFWKKNNNNDNDGDDGDDENGYEFRTPWWYIWGENEEREPEEESGAVLFIYLWTLVLLAGLFYVGNTMGMIEKKIESLRWALLGFLNYCFVTIVLLIGIEDAIETEGREMEETGFYGQRAVLLLVTCMLGMLQSIAFISWTTKRINKIKIESLSAKTDEYVGIEFEKDTTAGTPGYKAPV
mmetsp:Transcript_15945/g.36786  ORF Transcript_15945/g.36786 Transcript_15945/m.36786 type:complete len:262 (-) Transcript_15945:213-998(-)